MEAAIETLLWIISGMVFLIILQAVIYAFIVYRFGRYSDKVNKLYEDRTNEKINNSNI